MASPRLEGGIRAFFADMLGFDEFSGARRALWQWILRYQIPSARTDGALFAQFFEDHDTPTNRTAWAPLNLARYLLEKREQLDPEWRAHSGELIEFVRGTFTHSEFGVTVCHEQDEDKQAHLDLAQTWTLAAITERHALVLHDKAIAA